MQGLSYCWLFIYSFNFEHLYPIEYGIVIAFIALVYSDFVIEGEWPCGTPEINTGQVHYEKSDGSG